MLRSGIGSLLAAALSLAALLACAGAQAADGDDEYQSLMSDCGRLDLPFSDIDACMERAREMDMSNPSPQLQHLLTQLERRLEAGEGPAPTASSSAAATGSPHALLGATTRDASIPRPTYRKAQNQNADDPPREIEAQDTPPEDSDDKPAAPAQSPPHG